MRIIELCQDAEATLNEVAAVVGQDPAISAKLMRMANSPFYARKRKTENIRQAIALFGLNGTLVLALGFSVVGESRRDGGGIDHNQFWRRALACAICAQLLGARLEPARKEELFLAALLQDIGILAIEKVIPGFYAELPPSHIGHEQIATEERERLACDHAEVGAWLLQNWNMPEDLVVAVAHSHRGDPGNRFNQIVAVASLLGDLWWHEEDPQRRLRMAADAAHTDLDVRLEELTEIIEEAAVQLQATASTFDLDVAGHVSPELLLEKARELMSLITVTTLQETSALKEKAEALTTYNQRLREQNRRDNLTGLYNRAYFDQVLAAEYQLARENNFPLSVVFIDLDHFKQINDLYGHEVGDKALVHCARIIQENTRHSDVVARYGGEEFVAILPGTDTGSAQSVCERMLEALRRSPLVLDDGRALIITASIGIAVLDELEQVRDAYDLLRQADRALYKAKDSGRDQLKIYCA